MSKPLTQVLLSVGLFVSTTCVLADPELNRCLATNKAANRYEICYGQMHTRAFEQSKMERKERTNAIMKQLEAERAAKEQQAKSGQPVAPTPQPRVTQPRATPIAPTPTASPAVKPAQPSNEPIYGGPQSTPKSIFDQPGTPSAEPASPTNNPTPAAKDSGTNILPSKDSGKDSSGSGDKPSYPIQYY